jgi:hypothetical protein
MMKKIWSGLLLAVLLLTGIPALAEETPEQRFEMGIQVQESVDIFDLWARLVRRQLNTDWIELQVRWEEVEREPGKLDWTMLDLALPNAAEYDLKVLISVVATPKWAREPGANLDYQGPPADPADYANFVTAVLKRYPGMVHAVQVWEEMNLGSDWASLNGLNAADYITLLRTTHEAIKAVDPKVIVISGGLAPTGYDDGVAARDNQAFMAEMIAAGLLDYVDCVGVHHDGINIGPRVSWDAVPNDPDALFRGPFDNPHPSWSFQSTLQGYAEAISRAGGTQKLCVTHFGWASADDLEAQPSGLVYAIDNTLDEQRDWTIEALDEMEQSGYVWLAFLWNLNYGPQAGWNPENTNVPYSIIGPGTSFRPVFDAVAQWQLQYKERSRDS